MQEMGPAAAAAFILLLPVTMAAFAMLKAHQAAVVVLLFALMFLPEGVGIDLPVVPTLDKYAMPPLVVLVAILSSSPRSLRGGRSGFGLNMLLVLMVLGAFMTVQSNADPLPVGDQWLPGMKLYDSFSFIGRMVLTIIIPYVLGNRLIRREQQLGDLLSLIVLANLIYLPLELFELRMSPQLHNMLYGFAQHSFLQTVRDGKYRPMVFMAHGLELALFLCTGVVAAWALWRARPRPAPRVPRIASAICLSGVLSIINSLGALVFALVSVPLMLYASQRLQRRLLIVICVVVLGYPTLRASGWFPVDQLLDGATQISAERAESLQFRFTNEDRLLAKARDRILVGWGGYGRNRVFSEEGIDISVTDGAWIIQLGLFGATGFVAYFGLLTGSIWTAVRAMARMKGKGGVLLGGLAWIVALRTVDMLPNAQASYLTMFLAGCLSGSAAGLLQESRELRSRLRLGTRA